MRTERFTEARQRHGIPEHYGAGWQSPDGVVNFDWCDSTISVHPDGTATETHMGLGAVSHEFITTEWTAP